MPKIRVILETEDGQSAEQVFDLPGNLDNLDAIDEAVEQFKNKTLPGIEQELLQQSQERLAAQEKKQSLTRNGSDRVTVRTRHGMFAFRRQRFLTASGHSLCLLPELMSDLLQKRCVDWATRFCYSEGARLL